MSSQPLEGVLLIDKPLNITSFGVIAVLRRLTGIQKIGHCGTLDPLATGLLVCLVGKKFTRLSDSFLGARKAYVAQINLGSSTTTYDAEGSLVEASSYIPTLDEITKALETFQGETLQTPPQFSAKKVGGVKACDAARAGKTIELKPQTVEMNIDLLVYEYPLLKLKVDCSKGTYIRSLAHDLGQKLSCHGHLSGLQRIQSGSFSLDQAICLDKLKANPELLHQFLNNKSYV
jgi:tRNA pseudouridine55 synthase